MKVLLRGMVLDDDGVGVENAKHRIEVVVPKGKEGEAPLAKLSLAPNGYFWQTVDIGRRGPIEVRLFDGAGTRLVTKVIKDPAADEWLNLGVTDKGPTRLSEFDRLKRVLGKQMDSNDAARFAALATDRDLALALEQVARCRAVRLRMFGMAHAVVERIQGGEPEVLFALLDRLVWDGDGEQGPNEVAARLGEGESNEALEAAVADAIRVRVVPPRAAKMVDASLAALVDYRATQITDRPLGEGGCTLSQLVGVAGLSGKINNIAQVAAAKGLRVEAWKDTDLKGTDLTTDDREQLAGAFKLAHIAGYNADFVKEAKLFATDVGALAEDNNRVFELARNAGIPEDKLNDFAETVIRNVAVEFPMRRLRAIAQHPVKAVLTQYPHIDLRRTTIDAEARAPAVTLDPTQLSAVRSVQRALALAPEPDIAVLLANNGYDSASTFYYMGRHNTIAALKQLGIDKANASTIFHRACRRYTDLIQLISAANVGLQQTGTHASPGLLLSKTTQDEIKNDPTLSALFGSLDYGSWEHCRSVFSPAAYLVDLLSNFLAHRKIRAGATESLKDELKLRRLDIWEIKLDCENTNSEIPTIELVWEILDKAIADETGRATDEVLAQTYHSLNLPFDRHHSEMAVYLQACGAARARLMRAFLDDPDSSPELAAEELGLSPAELEIYEEPLQTTSAESLWNVEASEAAEASWPAKRFLDRAGISVDALLALLPEEKNGKPDDVPVGWVQGNEIAFVHRQSPLNLDDFTIENVTEVFLVRAHRFLRLWRHLGGSMQELDRMLRHNEIVSSESSNSIMVGLARFERLRRRFNIDHTRMLQLLRVKDEIEAEAKRRLSDAAGVDVHLDDDNWRNVFTAALGLSQSEAAALSNRTAAELFRFAVIARALGTQAAQIDVMVSLSSDMDIGTLAGLERLSDEWRVFNDVGVAATQVRSVLEAEIDDAAIVAVIEELNTGTIDLLGDDEAKRKREESTLRVVVALARVEEPLAAALLRLDGVQTDLEGTDRSAAIKAAEVLTRVGLLVRLFRLSVAETDALAVLNMLDAAAGSYQAMLDLATLLRRSRTFRDGELLSLIAGASQKGAEFKPEFLASLRSLTGWPLTEGLEAELKLTYPVGYQSGAALDRLAGAAAVLTTLGADATTCAALAATPTEGLVSKARALARAKFSDEAWAETDIALRAAIRPRERDAMVDFILGKKEFNCNNDDDLLSRFLIDVRVGPQMKTSRIVQATAAVQLFVERCLMGLEASAANIRPDPQDERWVEWKWLRSYRVWEANRKVFLYPENWLLPEHRRNKSPFFKEMEEALAQVELEDSAVESIFLDYLEKVQDVCKLRVAAIHHHAEPGSKPVTHILGRTAGVPTQFFYRRFAFDRWSAWEQVPLEVNSDHVAMTVFQGRVHLFWLIFSKVGEQEQGMSPDGAKPKTKARWHWQIQLAWTSLRDGKWAAPRIAERKMIHPWMRPSDAFTLRILPEGAKRLAACVYVATSHEFNDLKVYDEVREAEVRWASDYHLETIEPWHSGVFVFDGDVRSVELRDIRNSVALIRRGEETILTTKDRKPVVRARGPFGEDGTQILPMTCRRRGRLRQPNQWRWRRQTLVPQTRTSPDPQVADLYVTGSQAGVRLLGAIRQPSEIVAPASDAQFDPARPFVFQDSEKVFLVERKDDGRFCFRAFHHPLIDEITYRLRAGGVRRLFERDFQRRPRRNDEIYTYGPIALAVAAGDDLDYSLDGPCSLYNWEVFFHAPLLIAQRLGRNQRFEEALRWYHFVFDPSGPEVAAAPQRYWITKPLHELTQAQIKRQLAPALMTAIGHGEFTNHVEEWRLNPFDPHLVASRRLAAYQMSVLMSYLDTLIGWGDMLFRSERREALNMAGQLYMTAAAMLGPRPRSVPPPNIVTKTYADLEMMGVDALGNTRMAEAALPAALSRGEDDETHAENGLLPHVDLHYFGLPANDVLLAYWDRVEGRLHKLRNGMNIDGASLRLPLYDRPLDPGRAGAVTRQSVFSTVAPTYRFQFMVQKALEFCSEVKGLASSLLAALEKRDGEEMAALRSLHEKKLLEAAEAVRERQISEAIAQVEVLKATVETAHARREYYSSRGFMNPRETESMTHSRTSVDYTLLSTKVSGASAAALAIPDSTIGTSGVTGTPVATISVGGTKIIATAERGSSILDRRAGVQDKLAAMAATMAGYQRRQEEWDFQVEMADAELAQIERQLEAAEIRLDISRKEYENHRTSIALAAKVDQVMRTKFTNRELYDWMVGRLAVVYSEAYSLALGLSRRAEECYRFETLSPEACITGNQWDSLRKGLLAGDMLALDLRRMEAKWLESNGRTFELTKRVSLASLFPERLIELRTMGECEFTLGEWVFDMDHPGHCLRRIKSVSVSIPCVTHPNQGVNGTLRLDRSWVRRKDDASEDRIEKEAEDRIEKEADAFEWSPACNSIAISSGAADTGTFELNMRDERYLPFEGAGGVSQWELKLPREDNRFDFGTIADVIVEIRYTAELSEDSDLVETRRTKAAEEKPQVVLFSLRRDFPAAWYAIAAGNPDDDLALTLPWRDHFPLAMRDESVTLLGAAIDSDGEFMELQCEIEMGGKTTDFSSVNLSTDRVSAPKLVAPIADAVLMVRDRLMPGKLVDFYLVVAKGVGEGA